MNEQNTETLENEEQANVVSQQTTESTPSDEEQLLGEIASLNEDSQELEEETETLNAPEEEQPENVQTEENKPAEESETEVDESETEREQPLIDDNIIKQYPALKSYKGQPITAAAKAYDELRRSTTRLNQELAELKKQQVQQPKVEEKIPDPIDNPEEYQKYIQKKIEQRVEEMVSQRIKVLEDSIQPIAVEKKQQEIISALKTKLSDNTDPMTVIEGWKNDNQDLLFDNEGNLNSELIDFYDKHPEIFIRDVLNNFKLKEAESAIKQKKKETKQNLVNETKKALKTTTTNPRSEINSTPRTEAPLTDTEELLNEILQLNNEG